jgi:GH24 family phage-related lysozyme (muramidase)
MPTPLRDVPLPAVELIKAFEGIPDGDPGTVNIDAYLCPAGVWTIGWGHAIVDGGVQLKGAANRARARALYPGGITRAQAQTLLQADLIPRCASVLSLVRTPLNDGALGALVAFVFNVGAANFAASTLLKRLNAGDRVGAADQFLAWDKARVDGVLKALAGLTRRRKAERAMFLGQDWRAAGAVPASRSRGALPGPLPVPEMPDEDRAAAAAQFRHEEPERQKVQTEPGTPRAPRTPRALESPKAPKAPEVPKVPKAPKAPRAPKAPKDQPAATTRAGKRAVTAQAAASDEPPAPAPPPKPAAAAATVKPRGRTTTPKAQPPVPPARRRAPRTGR